MHSSFENTFLGKFCSVTVLQRQALVPPFPFLPHTHKNGTFIMLLFKCYGELTLITQVLIL